MKLTVRQKKLVPYYNMKVPKGKGPFPAVLLVSGCSGFHWNLVEKYYIKVAEALLYKRFAVLFVDYLKSRKIDSCFSGVSQQEIAKDILSTIQFISKMPKIDKSKIIVIGWSYGAGAVLEALNRDHVNKILISKAICYYPAIFGITVKHVKSPILVLYGDSDNVASYKRYKKYINRLPDKSLIIEKIFKNALHAFDMKGLPAKLTHRTGGHVGYNKSAADKSWKIISSFLNINKKSK